MMEMNEAETGLDGAATPPFDEVQAAAYVVTAGVLGLVANAVTVRFRRPLVPEVAMVGAVGTVMGPGVVKVIVSVVRLVPYSFCNPIRRMYSVLGAKSPRSVWLWAPAME